MAAGHRGGRRWRATRPGCQQTQDSHNSPERGEEAPRDSGDWPHTIGISQVRDQAVGTRGKFSEAPAATRAVAHTQSRRSRRLLGAAQLHGHGPATLSGHADPLAPKQGAEDGLLTPPDLLRGPSSLPNPVGDQQTPFAGTRAGGTGQRPLPVRDWLPHLLFQKHI